MDFYVAGVEASARCYRESFGFTEPFRTPVHAELRLGEFTLGSRASAHSGRCTGHLGWRATAAELAVWTEEVGKAHAGLVASGVRTLSPPPGFLDSLRAAWVTDPGGNPVQVVTRRPD
ncbi:MAG TPA: VOC family protein [Streptosporangiaceae bacterium]